MFEICQVCQELTCECGPEAPMFTYCDDSGFAATGARPSFEIKAVQVDDELVPIDPIKIDCK